MTDLEKRIEALKNEIRPGSILPIQLGGMLEEIYFLLSDMELSANVNLKLEQLKNQLLGGAGPAFDTLHELASALGDDPNFSTTVSTALAKRIRFDNKQELTEAEKVQARENIGALSAQDNTLSTISDSIVDLNKEKLNIADYTTDNTVVYWSNERLFWTLNSYYDLNTKTYVASSAYQRSQFIEVHQGAKIRLSMTVGIAGLRGIDVLGNDILKGNNAYFGVANNAQITDVVVEIPPGVVKLEISTRKTATNNLDIFIREEFVKVKELKKQVNNLSEYNIYSEEISIPLKWQNQYYDYIQKKYLGTSAHNHSNIVDLTDRTFLFSGVVGSEYGIRGISNDGNDVFFAGSVYFSKDPHTQVLNEKITFPDDVARVEISIRVPCEFKFSAIKNHGEIDHSFIVNKIIAPTKTNLRHNFIKDSYIGTITSTGVIRDTNNGDPLPDTERISRAIPVRKGDRVRMFGCAESTNKVLAFFDKNGKYISGVNGGGLDALVLYDIISVNEGSVVFATSRQRKVAAYEDSWYEVTRDDRLRRENFNVFDGLLTFSAFNNLISSPEAVDSLLKAKLLTVKKETNYIGSGCISFVDDDGHLDVYTKLYPFMKSRNLNFGEAIVGGYVQENSITINGYPRINTAQLNEMVLEGHTIEFMSHSLNHYKLGSLSPDAQKYQIQQNHYWMLSRGILSRSLVLPYGSYNEDTKSIVSLLYPSFYDDSSNGLNVKDNTVSTTAKMINRIQFGVNSARLTAVKEAIDKAIADDLWVVVMIHVGGFDSYEGWWTDFENLCDYIKSTGIPCLRPSDAYKIFKEPI